MVTKEDENKDLLEFYTVASRGTCLVEGLESANKEKQIRYAKIITKVERRILRGNGARDFVSINEYGSFRVVKNLDKVAERLVCPKKVCPLCGIYMPEKALLLHIKRELAPQDGLIRVYISKKFSTKVNEVYVKARHALDLKKHIYSICKIPVSKQVLMMGGEVIRGKGKIETNTVVIEPKDM